MTKSIDAVFERGIFKPTAEVSLTDGTHVEVLIPHPETIRDPKAVAARLAELADKAQRHNIPESTSTHHDSILYDRKNQP